MINKRYPQPQSLDTLRFRKNVAFNKPALPGALDTESIAHTNGIRSNWSITTTDKCVKAVLQCIWNECEHGQN